MGLISIDNIEPGMILESDLHTPDGRFLLPGGTVLMAPHIKTCKAWGIYQADIIGLDQDKANASRLADIDPDILKQSRQYLKPYFTACNVSYPPMKEITRIAIEKTARRLKSGVCLPGFPEDDQPDHDNGATGSFPKRSYVSALELVQKQSKLLSLPDIFFKIMEVMESPFSSANHIADVVSKDASISARLLRLVNSAYFGFPSRIDTISRAVAILGNKELASLAMGISVVRTIEGIPAKYFSMEDFWRHSITCGVISGLISSRLPVLSRERYFLAGLLHDLGRLIIIKCLPDAFLESMILSNKQRIPFYEAEKQILGFDHARLGGLLCKEWKMPVALEQMVRFHHEPSKATNVSEPGAIHLANILALASYPEVAGEPVFPGLCEKAWESVGLGQNDLFPIVQQADRKVGEIIQIFLAESKK